MSKLLEYLRLCRLCLVKENVNVPIFADSSDVRQIFLKISACLPVKVSQDDNLPKHICDSCLYKVDLLYQFWNTSVNAEKQLIQWITELGLTVTSKKDAPVHLMAQSQSHSQPHSITETIMLKEEHLEMETQQQHGYSGFDIPYQPEVNMTVGASADLDSALHEDVKVGGSKRRGRPPKQKVLVTSAPPVSVPVLAGRKRRSSATKAAAAFAAHASSDDSDADDKLASDTSEPDFEPAITKEEADSEDEEYVDNPDSLEPTTFVDASSTCDPEQAGPSGLMGAPVTTRNAAMPANTEPGSEDMQSNNTLLKDPLFVPKFQCHVCYKPYATEHSLHRHIRTHLATYIIDKPKLTCTYCQKQYQSHFYLEKHVQMYHTDTNVTYNCNVCDKQFKYKCDLQKHINHSFPPDKDLSCPNCDKKFHHEKELKIHIAMEKLESLKCYACDDTFTCPNALQEHAAKTHGSEHCQFRCQLCSKPFSFSQSMRVHMRTAHLGEEMHMCEVCGKKLTSRASLRDHMLLHRGERPLTCEQCGKTFAKRNTLNVHRRTHTGAKPYTCETCGKSFTQISTLTIHRRKHTGDRPYPCTLCPQKFMCKNSLTAHQQAKHKLLASVSQDK